MAKKNQSKPEVDLASVEETPVLKYWGKGNAAPDKAEFSEINVKAAFYRRLHPLALSQEQDVKTAFEGACREILP